MKTEDFQEKLNNGEILETQEMQTAGDMSNSGKQTQQVSFPKVASRALVIFLPLALLFGSALGVFYYTNVKAERAIVESAEPKIIDLQQKIIAHDFRSIVSDMIVLSQHGELKSLLDGHYEARDKLAEEFFAFSKGKRCYDQVRYLDETGMEVIRINFNEGKPSLVPDDKLQNKSNRYYFADAFALNNEGIFISSLDLNIENGIIERPLKENISPGQTTFDSIWKLAKGRKYVKPMMRFATPVFNSKGQKKGIVLLNFFGAQLINAFNKMGENSLSKCFLVNRDGFWLKGPNSEVEWGFMRDHDKEQTFANTFSQAWPNISKEESGQFYTAEGLFTFTTIYPLFENAISSTGSSQAFQANADRFKAKGYYWKIISHVPPSVLYAKRNAMAGSLFIVGGLLTVIFGIGSWLLARNAVVNNTAAQEIKLLSKFPSENPNPVLRITQDGQILYSNKAGKLLLAKWNADIGTIVPQKWRSLIAETFASEKGKKEEEVVVEGKIFSVTIASVKEAGYANLYATDITKRKQAEEELEKSEKRLQSAVTNSPFPIMIHADDGEIFQINDAWTELTGYCHEDIPTISEWTKRAYGEKKETVKGRIDKIFDCDTKVAEGEYVITAKDGSTLIWDFSSASLGTLSDGRRAVISMAADVTERKQAEKKLETAMHNAEAANIAKGRFLANMSHEIRTPMNIITGFAGLLADEQLTDDQKECTELIQKAGKSLLGIIDDILSYSRIEAGKLEINFENCSLKELIEGIDSMMRLLADEKDLEFKVFYDEKLPLMINTDSGRVHQCLVNLVNNAIKFTKKGHVHLKASVQDKDQKSFIRFDVEDTGIGIPDDKQEHVFASFSQVNESDTRIHGGTGLGLAITKRLAKLLNGEVTLTSQEGKGSVFSLLIPTGVDINSQPTFTKTETVPQATLENNETHRLSGKILVAEDIEASRRLMCKLLEPLGLDVTLAEDGNQVVQMVQEQTFDLILMDIRMPGLNGYETTDILRKKGITTPIIALTAYAMKGDREKCLEAGCNDYISKPFDKDKLNLVLSKYLLPNTVSSV